MLIVNSPPSFTSLSIGFDVLGNSYVANTGGWNDADGDAEGYDYAWTINGAPSGTTDTLAAAALSPGDTIVLTATANDGTTTGNTLTETTVHSNGLSLDQSSLDFGELDVGCVVQDDITITNIGSTSITISSVWYDDLGGTGEIAIAGAPSPGTVLTPGGTAVVTILYAPATVDPSSGELHIESNDPANPDFVVPVSGSAHLGARQTDTLSYASSVDLLFVVDNSCSMSDEQISLGTDATAMFAELDANLVDYQVGVVTTDNGSLQGFPSIITSSDPDPAGTFASNVLVGINGSGIEMGFQFGYDALTAPLVNTNNFGFLRPDASLRIVFVSDEQEQSGGVVADWVNDFEALKADPSMVSLSGITGGLAGCSGPGGSASSGSIYVDATSITGGLDLSICEGDWVPHLEDIAAWATPAVAPDEMPLTELPVVDTIVLAIDGVPQTGWIYDTPSNSLQFATIILAPGEVMTAEYSLSGDWCLDNAAPIASIVQTGYGATCEEVILDASTSSDADGDDIVQYWWSIESQPVGSELTEANLVHASPELLSVYPDVPGLWEFGLFVEDEFGASSLQDTYTVAVAAGGNPSNDFPEAWITVSAGDDDDSAGDDDDSAGGDDDDSVGGDDDDSVGAPFWAGGDDDDSVGGDDDDSAVSDAGSDIVVSDTVTCAVDPYGNVTSCPTCAWPAVTLDGTGSFDPDGADLGFSWTALDLIPATDITPADAAVAGITLVGGIANTAPGFQSETVEVELEVEDCNGDVATSSVIVTWECTAL